MKAGAQSLSGFVMSVFDRVRALLRADTGDRNYTADLKPIMDFSTLDLEKIRKDLAIEKRAAERGTRDEPPADTIGLDEVELEIVGSVSCCRFEGQPVKLTWPFARTQRG